MQPLFIKFGKNIFRMLRKVVKSMFSVFEKIKELAKKQGKSLGDIETALGYGRNTLYKIKNSTPNAERIKEIADYFGVSADYLLGRTDDPRIAGAPSEKKDELEMEITSLFRLQTEGLTEDEKERFTIAVKDLMATARNMFADDSLWKK